MSLQIHVRDLPNVAILSLEGRVTLGEGSSALRQAVKDALARGSKRMILNLSKVPYIDSAGLGELVGTYATVRNQGGDVKLVGVQAKVQGLLQVTKLHTVFEVCDDEATAVAKLNASAGAGA
jgi:anti-sigma B factor antagonist